MSMGGVSRASGSGGPSNIDGGGGRFGVLKAKLGQAADAVSSFFRSIGSPPQQTAPTRSEARAQRIIDRHDKQVRSQKEEAIDHLFLLGDKPKIKETKMERMLREHEEKKNSV